MISGFRASGVWASLGPPGAECEAFGPKVVFSKFWVGLGLGFGFSNGFKHPNDGVLSPKRQNLNGFGTVLGPLGKPYNPLRIFSYPLGSGEPFGQGLQQYMLSPFMRPRRYAHRSR